MGDYRKKSKRKALYYLDDMKNLQRWEHENPKMAEKRKQVLNELRKKLNTLQPSEKKSVAVSFISLPMESR